MEGSSTLLREANNPKGLFCGLCLLDVVQLVERLPQPDEKVRALADSLSAGGPATNASIAFQSLGSSTTLLLTRTYSDSAGDFIRRELSSFGVEVKFPNVDASERTTVASILVTESTGQRAVVSSADQYHPSVKPDSIPSIDVTEFGVIQLDGYELDMALPLAQQAHQCGVPVLLDGGSFKDTSAQLLSFVDVAALSARFTPPGCNGVNDTMEYVLGLGVDLVMVTDGEGPVVYSNREGLCGAVRPPKVNAVDTLGAGDFFHGALSYYVASNGVPQTVTAIEDSIGFASSVAAHSVESFGTRSWLKHIRHDHISDY
ncbi:PfkB family carbohydrate kinase [Auritidibacter ignavus]|uniref:PfkB family carbohydrate kinase n=1 Tax=Auritidibacter ignavus TaxID=678932 RepID=UPI00109C9AB3